MPYFPQLFTGALSQYPITRRLSYRTITNELEDGSRVVLADTNAALIHWEMTYDGLSDEESDILIAFFASVEGRLTSFTFWDPVDNLLGWSETLSAAAWQSSSLLALTTPVSDPLGTQRATNVTNNGSGSLGIGQTIEIPGAVVCCWSFYARSNSLQEVTLTRTSGSASSTCVRTAGPNWRRFELSSSLPAGGDASIFQVVLSAGASLDFFGFQLDAQPAASQYVQTAAVGGVYPATRFDMDEITVTRTGPNQNSCVLRLVTRVNG